MSIRLYDALKEIPNYHDPRGVIYKLADLHFMMICAILCGMRNTVEIVEYISYRIDDFRKILDVKSVPSHDTISRVYIHTDWTYLTKHLQDWLECNYSEKSKLYQGRREKHRYQRPLHFGEGKRDKMDPGHAGFPGSYRCDSHDRRNRLQRKIMKKILSKGGHFMIPIKDNQTALLESVKSEKNRLMLTGKWDELPSGFRNWSTGASRPIPCESWRTPNSSLMISALVTNS